MSAGSHLQDLGSQASTLPLATRRPDTDQKPDVPGRAQPQQVYRPRDLRPAWDESRLRAAGIRMYESTHLRLYTDIDPVIARQLPPLVDQIEPAWREYFGELPPDRDGRDFQVTGYLIADRVRFEQLGMIPPDLPPFVNGRHRGLEFWMNEQEESYYRRHLLLHEATHCFMTLMEPRGGGRPPWYIEGMAELFATHRVRGDGVVEFAVYPQDFANFEGLGRISMLRDETRNTGPWSWMDVRRIPAEKFLDNDSYAWSWALCQFLHQHPGWTARFRELGTRFSAAEFEAEVSRQLEPHAEQLDTEWQDFIARIEPNFDFARTAFVWTAPEATTNDGWSTYRVDRGWQSTGVRVKTGQTVAIVCRGRYEVARTTSPWIAEPQGVSIEYVDGVPLGSVLATIHDPSHPESVLKWRRIGRSGSFPADFDGVLLLRIADHPSRLRDNRGAFEARIVLQDSSRGS